MTRDRMICERCGEWVDCVAGMPWQHTCRPELDSLGRVPPDEGQLHFVKDADGNVEDVSDEELEAAAQWFDARFSESSEVGRDTLTGGGPVQPSASCLSWGWPSGGSGGNMEDAWHKQQYEQALAFAEKTDALKWEDLTEEQRENIRKINRQHQSFMDDLGAAIATGGPLPNPLGAKYGK